MQINQTIIKYRNISDGTEIILHEKRTVGRTFMKILLKGIWKTMVSMLLICGLCLGSLDVTAFAGSIEGTCGDDLTWKLDTDGTLTISGNGEMHNYSEWTQRQTSSPWYMKDEKQIVIEDGVASIGMYAFEMCSKVSNVTISTSVTKINSHAFWSCEKLTDITIPASVTEIGTCAFAGCEHLKTVTILSGVKKIGGSAFYC